MEQSLTPQTYRHLSTRAQEHVLRGGGLLPGADDDNRDDAIARVADRHFRGLKRREELEDAVSALPFAVREQILSAAWALVGSHSDAAYTFGSMVRLQAQHPLSLRLQARRGGGAARKATRR